MVKRVNAKEIDADKLKRYITSTGKTLSEFSCSIGKSKTYLACMSGKKQLHENIVKLICEKLGVQEDYFDYTEKTEATDEKELQESIKALQDEVRMLTDLTKDTITWQKSLHEMVQNIQKKMDVFGADIGNTFVPILDSTEVIRKKTCANTVQLEKIKDYLKDLQETELDRAKEFLQASLQDGGMEGKEIIRRADEAGIRQRDLMKAKKS